MPAVTSIIAAAGAAASAGQAISANQRRKKDEAAAKTAAANLRGLTETDYSAGLQVPTMGYNLAQQGIQQQEASGLQALQETGAAGVLGGVPSLVQAGNQANQELSADLQQAEYNRDLYRSQNRQGIEGRRMERAFDIGASELQGAQSSALQNREMVNQGISGAFSGLTSMGESIATNQALYKAIPKTGVTMNDALAPFQQPLNAEMLGGQQVKGAPRGTMQYGNSSYAPGYSPFGQVSSLTIPRK
jgi:hypothetical protein